MSMNCKHTADTRLQSVSDFKQQYANVQFRTPLDRNGWEKKLRYSLHTVIQFDHDFQSIVAQSASSLFESRQKKSYVSRANELPRYSNTLWMKHTLPNGTITYLHFTMWSGWFVYDADALCASNAVEIPSFTQYTSTHTLEHIVCAHQISQAMKTNESAFIGIDI